MSPRFGYDLRAETATYSKCTECGAKHLERPRRPGWCLQCDIEDQHGAGATPYQIAAGLDLPTFLVRDVLP